MRRWRSRVSDGEVLYRRVPAKPGNTVIDQASGRLLPSSQAFADRSGRPSVDRQRFLRRRPSDPRDRMLRGPRLSQEHATDAVLEFPASAVRRCSHIMALDHRGVRVDDHPLCVVPDPVPSMKTLGHELAGNRAHAEIRLGAGRDSGRLPDPVPDGLKKRMRHMLAQMARNDAAWAIQPTGGVPARPR